MSNFYKSIDKYYNFTNKKNIPLIDQLVLVFDINLFNLYASKYLSTEIRFTEKDYWDDNIIMSVCIDNKIIGYVLVLEKTNSTINFMLSNIKFKERICRSIVLFAPLQKEIKNSITKPYFTFFPYFFGDHDKDIVIKNKIYYNYLDIKWLFCLGLFEHFNMEILEFDYDFDKNQLLFQGIRNIK